MRLSPILALLVLGCAPAATAQTNVAVAPFRSVALSDGGQVNIRHGATQRVTVLSGEAEIVTDGNRLRVRKCRTGPRRDRLEVEIVTPVLDSLAVEDGGRITLVGDFPTQARLAAAVDDGGVIDARPLRAETVAASVNQGGLVYVRPGARLDAAVSHGGAIT